VNNDLEVRGWESGPNRVNGLIIKEKMGNSENY
jgi:hypothetical protein